MADLATLQTRLTEAETAYHALATGTKEVEVRYGEMDVKYTAATMEHLKAYIADLRSQIVSAGGTNSGLSRRGIVVDL